MDFLKNKMAKTESQSESNPAIRQAEEGWNNAKREIESKIFALGKAYYEKNKDNPNQEYSEQIKAIESKTNEEYLWHQYRLSIDGQRICDSCDSVITSDSAFCNRCGAKVEPIDFSSILVEKTVIDVTDKSDNTKEQVCSKCGKKLVEGALFCEACGTKIV